MQQDFNILLVTNKSDFVNEFPKLIRINHGAIDAALNEDEAVSLFDERQHAIIVFLYSSIELSQDVYFNIYKKSRLIQQTQHRAILLCDHVDIEIAYDKCMRNIFFDYVVLSPRFDKVRINLSVRNALMSIKQTDHEISNREFSRVGKSVGEYNAEVSEIIDKSSLITMNNDRSFKELSDEIKNNIKNFSVGLMKIGNESVRKMTKDDIVKEVDKFSSDVIEKNIQCSKDKVHAVIRNYTDRLVSSRARHSDVVSSLGKLSLSVAKSVLVVEDDEIYGEIVKTIINKTGAYNVTLVATVHEGMVFTVTRRPDIVFLDYELPDATAGEFLERVRAVPSAKNIPVIILTSHDNKDVYTSTIMLGAQDFLAKPASEEKIMEKIGKWLECDDNKQ